MIPGSLRIFCLIILLWPILFATLSHSKEIPTEETRGKLGTLSIPFIANDGQVDKDVSFYARTFAGTVFVTKVGSIGYSLTGENGHAVIREEIQGASLLTPKGEGASVTRIASFAGNDPTKWKSNIPTYESISLGEISKGVTLSLKAKGKNVEKIFTVNPGVKPLISVKLFGAKDLNLSDSGELEVITELGPVEFTKPVAYQEIEGKKVNVPVAYALAPSESGTTRLAATYQFAVGGYDPKYPLVIDPLLASTYLGGLGYDVTSALAVDAQGNVYIIGHTASTDFPTTEGAYGRSYTTPGYFKIFVSKLDAGLSTLLASTYIGGSKGEIPHALALDANGNVYITGITTSTDYPTKEDAYSRTYGRSDDPFNIFVSKLDTSLSTLLASTYIGGWSKDEPSALALDAQGSVYVTGYTNSSDYPTTDGAYSRVFTGNSSISDAFVSKFDSNLSVLLASTYLGGSRNDSPSALVLDKQGNVYVTGSTDSTDYPTTEGAYDRTSQALPGLSDVFISKLDAGLSTLLASTYVGGSYADASSALALDVQGNVYITGFTVSTDYPTSAGAYSRVFTGNSSISDAFVSKFDSSLSVLLASTYIGGSSQDGASGIALDPQGNVYITGSTHSRDYPTTRGAFCRVLEGSGQSYAFISKLDSNLSGLLASTYIGGPWNDSSASTLALDAQGNTYIAGITTASNYPTTAGAYDRTFHAGRFSEPDTFVSRLNSDLSASGPYSVTVVKTGKGNGTVTGPAAQIDCGSTCTGTVWSNELVTLVATPDEKSSFWGWTGACTGLDSTCSFYPADNVTANALFYPKSLPWGEYFPLRPNTTWDYIVNGEKERITVLKDLVVVEGVEASVLEHLPDKSQNYYTSGDQGILFHGSFLPHQHISGYRRTFNIDVSMIPPVILTTGATVAGEPVGSRGLAYYTIHGLEKVNFYYEASHTVQGLETITVPAGTFETIKISYTLNMLAGTETGELYLAKGIGLVRETYAVSGTSVLRELAATNIDVHDLAVTSVTAPATVNFTKRTTSRTLPVKVTIQNRGPYPETISDSTMLANLISLTATSLGQCPNPKPVATSTAPQKSFPITLKSKDSLTVNYNVTLDCVNDRLRSTAKDPHHYDYRFSVTVDHAAIDGIADGHPVDDICPRTVAPTYILDPYPDGTIKDKGCGARKMDGTFGNDILLDIVAPG